MEKIQTDIGKALKEQQEAAGLSQSELAKGVGMHQQTISRWESNENAPNVLDCIRLAQFYGITLEELLGISLP